MYSARVEAISGTKILAGGKWLQCIGNKTFHVGELAWTDGRCAYGNHYTPQQPLVITAPVDDKGIPILFLSTCCTYDKRLKAVASNDPISNLLTRIINDRKGNVYRTATYLRDAILINSFAPLGIIAANVDEGNNFYAIRMRYVGAYRHAEIKKNGTVINSFEPDNYVEQVKARVKERCTYLPGKIEDPTNTYGTGCWIYWGFIEDEHNWALIMAINSYATNQTHEKVGETRSGFGGRLDVERYNYHTASEHSTFLITQDGVTKLHHIEFDSKDFSGVDWRDADTGAYCRVDREIIHQDSAGVDAPDCKIPMQDGYYYTMTDVVFPDDRTQSGWVSAQFPAHLTLFTPTGEKITEGDFLLFSRITICRLGKEKYLIGVDNEIGIVQSSSSPLPKDGYISAGLYLCEQGVLTLIKSGNCKNHRLRLMKKINDWQNRIREIT